MKKYNLLSILIAITTLSFGQISGTIRFSADDYELRDTLGANNELYTYFSSNPYDFVVTPGLPFLPVRYEQFILPYGMKIDSIIITVSSQDTIKPGALIFPKQHEIASCLGCPKPPFKAIDTSIYFSNDPFPVAFAEPQNYGYWHTSNIATIGFYPYYYLPSINKLIFNGVLQYYIYYSLPQNASSKAPEVKMRNDKYGRFINQLTARLENPGDISAFLTGIEILSDGHSEAEDSSEYLVIAPGSFIESQAMKDFVLWKKKRGIDMIVLSIADIYSYAQSQYWVDDIGNTSSNSNSISDNAAKLRKYLQLVYQNAGAEWILLVGDANLIPERKFWATHGPNYDDDSVITDKYYADFNSDYNVDGDTCLGEWGTTANPQDLVDLHPEAYVGRILCSNLQEFTNWVAKLVNYETNPGNGETDYLQQFNLTMADEFQEKIEQNQYIYNNLTIFDTTIYKELPSYDTVTPTVPYGSAIIAGLNLKPGGWWTWSNHGLPTNFASLTHGVNNGVISSVNTGSTSNGLLFLSNVNKYGIIHSGCCSIASFGSSANCMAQEVLAAPLKGSVAISGCTDLSWIEEEYRRLKDYTTTIRNSHDGSITTTGHTGVLEWAANPVSGGERNHETYLTHNYFGDPEMLYYTKIPTRLDATISPRHIDATQTDTVHIVVNNLATNDTVVVCLYKPANGTQVEFQRSKVLKGVKDIDTVSFIIPAYTLTNNLLYVTISGFNYLPYTGEIIVSPGCGYVSTPEYITTTPYFPWSGVRFKDRDVIINPGVTLTVTGSVYFVPGAKVIVKQGGKLLIDGGKLASSCENLWKGVEVWGNSGLTQYSTVNQGFIQVTNNGSIEDAICAISTAKLDTSGNFIPGTTGGIFSCTQAKFRNNRSSIHVYPYQYQNYNYNSNLSNCDFVLDELFLEDTTSNAMVVYDNIKGIGNTGLRFISKLPETVPLAKRGIGISAINAGFRLTHICSQSGNPVPCTEFRRPYFEGLYYGIRCSSTGAAKLVQIENCDFENNLRGIYLSAVVNPNLTLNTFKTRAASWSLQSSGIYLNACTGYSVQENSFTGNFSVTNQNTFETGIVVNNSGTAPNEIYNNLFYSLMSGITAQDTNVGLVCKCNDYANNKFDQSALVSGTPGTLGIASMQGAAGSVTSPAGNTFSPEHKDIQLHESDLKNQGAPFQYFHHIQAQPGLPPRVEPYYISTSIGRQNTGWGYDKLTACPSRLNGGGGGTPVESSVEELVQQKTLIHSLEIGLRGLVDGGNTEETTADIVFSNPEESFEIYNDLLSKSPYLSDTVMTEAATKEEVLSNPLLFDILVANPQSATSEGVLDQLDLRVDPMPEDLYNEILEGENILPPLTAAKASIAALKTDNSTMYYDLMIRYLSDTSQYATDSLLYLLDVQNTAEAAYLEVFIQLNSGDFSAMNSTLSGITSKFDLSNEEQILHSYFQQFFTLLHLIQTDTLSGLQADSLTIEQIEVLMENAPEPVKSYCRNILIANNAIEYHEPYLYDDGLKSLSVKKKHRMGSPTKQVSLQLFPNPAKDYIIVRYNLANELYDTQEKAVLEMVTTTGQVIKSLTLQDVTGQVVVSTKTFVPGVYIIHIKGINKKEETTKFTVVH